MNTVAVFVGLDYHQDSVQVSVLDGEGKQLLNRGCRNDWEEIVEAVKPWGQVQAAAMEACGGAADLAEELRDKAGWRLDLAHPQYVAKLKGSPDKTDYSDSRLLADLTRVGYLPTVWLASAYEIDLRQLVNHRQSLVDYRRAVKLRIGAVLREHRAKAPQDLSRWSGPWIYWAKTTGQLSQSARWIVGDLMDELEHLNKKVTAVEKRLEELTADDAHIKTLLAQPGIGPVTAWVWRAFVGPVDRFASGKHLSRYCGLSPCNSSTGSRQADAGLIQGCNRLLRATLIQAGHRLMRTEKRWMEFAQKMRSRGKPACVIVAAVANRWVRGLWHELKELEDVARQTKMKSL
jgi:transposase